MSSGKANRGRRNAGRDGADRRGLPRTAIAVVALLLLAAAALVGVVPRAVAIAYFVASGVSLVLYGWDKAAAGRGARRTPEKTLHLFDLLGGWPGALIAQQQFRHKTAKTSFQAMFWVTVVVNVAVVGWLLSEGGVPAPKDATGSACPAGPGCLFQATNSSTAWNANRHPIMLRRSA